MNKFEIVIVHNIISPYKTLLFNALLQTMDDNFLVLYLAETEGMREWKTDNARIRFSFEVMFEGRLEDTNRFSMIVETYRKLSIYNPEVVVIVGYSYLACWTALVWARKNGKKVIAVIESHYLDRTRSRIRESVKRVFVSNCDAALVDGTRHRDYTASLGLDYKKIFIKGGTGPVDVSLYQMEVSRFKGERKKICKSLGVPQKNFLYVGRFSREKNIIFLLDAYRRIKYEGLEDWGLILVGNGPQRQEIEDFILKNNIEDVFLPGFKQEKDLPLFYAISDVFILPSISEPWGLVVAEAMACGLPVLVSTRCGCYPDIVLHGRNGFCFDPFDEKGLTGLMCDIAQDRVDLQAMGAASLEIIKGYTPETSAKVYADAIHFVLGL